MPSELRASGRAETLLAHHPSDKDKSVARVGHPARRIA